MALEIIFMVVEYLVHFLLAFAIGFGIKWINDKRLREIAEDAVLFVQQASKHKGWDNDQKFEEAKKYLVEQLSLTPFFNDTKAKALIESAVKRAKREFEDLW